MPLKKRVVWAIAILLPLAVASGLLLRHYWYYFPGIYAALTNPIQPNQPITWERGPETPATPLAQRPPNIILIVADDLGYNDTTASGEGVAQGAVQTPNIDSIAQQGINLTQAYAGNATCAPSRAAMMTGRYGTRFGFEFTPVPKPFSKMLGKPPIALPYPPIYHAELESQVPPMMELAVPTTELTLPQHLKSQGYHTLMVGKWHLGETAQTRPEARGFDEFLGFLSGAALYLPSDAPDGVEARLEHDPIDKFFWANLDYAVVQHRLPGRFRPDKYMTDYLSEQAAQAIQANQNRPFFLYLAYSAPHTPLQALKSDYDALPQLPDHTLRVYAAMIRALDRGVGTVLQAVRDAGLEENTLVIFTSDNGGPNNLNIPDLNKPFRGWKATFFEGGIRVPLFIKWPARIAPGSSLEHAVGHVDIFATAAAAAGAALPAATALDGVNLLPYFTGTPQTPPHEALFWRSGHYKVLLAGDWKLQVSAHPEKTWLFNLREDPTERTNRALSEPDQVAALKAILERIDAEQARPLWPSLLEGPIFIDRPAAMPAVEGEDYVYWPN